MVSAANENYDLHIYRLTADYTGVASLVANPWHGGYREAPALFKRGGVYFMLTSAATGWNPNQQQYATATSIAGPWTAMANVGDSTAFGSQTAYVLPGPGHFGHLVPLHGRPLGQLLRRDRQRLPVRLAAVDLPHRHDHEHVLVPRDHASTPPPARSPATAARTTRSSPATAASAWTWPTSRCRTTPRSCSTPATAAATSSGGSRTSAAATTGSSPITAASASTSPRPPRRTARTSSSTPAAAAPTSSGSGRDRRLLHSSRPGTAASAWT